MSHLDFLKICISCSVTPPHQRNIAQESLGIDTAHGHSPSTLPWGIAHGLSQKDSPGDSVYLH